MKPPSNRSYKVARLIQKQLSQIIEHYLRDPRLGLININAVNLNGDLSVAKVYFTIVGDFQQDSAEVQAQLLNKSAGFLRSQLVGRVQLNRVPRLHFHYDKSILYAAHIESLINNSE